MEKTQKLILLFTVGFFVAVAIFTWLIAVYSPVDFVVTTDYIVVDTGKELLIAVKPGKCVKLSQIYLPPDTPMRIIRIANLTSASISITSVMDVVNILGNVTLDVVTGTYNATTLEICSGYAVIRYAK